MNQKPPAVKIISWNLIINTF